MGGRGSEAVAAAAEWVTKRATSTLQQLFHGELRELLEFGYVEPMNQVRASQKLVGKFELIPSGDRVQYVKRPDKQMATFQLINSNRLKVQVLGQTWEYEWTGTESTFNVVEAPDVSRVALNKRPVTVGLDLVVRIALEPLFFGGE